MPSGGENREKVEQQALRGCRRATRGGRLGALGQFPHPAPHPGQQIPNTRHSFRLLRTTWEDVECYLPCSTSEASGALCLGEQMGKVWRMPTGKGSAALRSTHSHTRDCADTAPSEESQNESCIISTKPQGTFRTRLYTNK